MTAPDEAVTTSAPPAPPRRHVVGRRKLSLLPALLTVLLLATLLWFRQADLDTVSQDALANGQVSEALWQHIRLTAISTSLTLLIALPLGVLLIRGPFRRTGPVAKALACAVRVTPAIGLLALPAIWLGTGSTAALIGITACAVPPVLSHTVAGLKANDVTGHLLTGVRTALVLSVGTATLAAFVGGGGLGVLIATGITTQRVPVLLLGSILTVALALLLDWLASLAELLVRPRGL